MKLANVQRHREERQLEKKRCEEELEEKKTELEKRKQAQREELNRRANTRLARPKEVKTGNVVTHRGVGAFTDTAFELMKQIRATENKLVSINVT